MLNTSKTNRICCRIWMWCKRAVKALIPRLSTWANEWLEIGMPTEGEEDFEGERWENIIYSLLCSKLPQKLWLNTTNIWFFNSVGLEFKSGLIGWFWLQVLWDCSQAVGWGCSHLKAWPGLEDLHLKGLTDMPVGKMPQCLHHMSLSSQ